MAQTVKRLSTMQETRVQALVREDPLEKEIAIRMLGVVCSEGMGAVKCLPTGLVPAFLVNRLSDK